jgi:acetylglutamate kinase
VIAVLKVGGAAAAPVEQVQAILDAGNGVVIVHGGGPQISAACAERGIAAQFVDGQRVTTPAVLEVVRNVLEGQNGHLVATLRQAGVTAAGVVGALAATPVSDHRLGLVGTVAGVETSLIQEMVDDGVVAVVNPFAGLNVNADTAAAAVAIALGAEELTFISDVPGVLDGDGGVIGRIATGDIAGLVDGGTIVGGMLPKLTAGSTAIAGGVWRVRIGSGTLVTA